MNTAPVAPPVERSPLDAPAPPAGDGPHEAWFSRLARLSARRRGRVMLLWLAITLVAAIAAVSIARRRREDVVDTKDVLESEESLATAG